MQYLTKTFYFCAAHQYGHKDWSDAKNIEVFGFDAKNHGHNYTLEVTVKGSINPETGFIVDLGELKKIVKNNILDSMDHSQIENDIPWFKDKQPSSENMVVFIWEMIESKLTDCTLHRIRLIETPTIKTDYYGPDSC